MTRARDFPWTWREETAFLFENVRKEAIVGVDMYVYSE